MSLLLIGTALGKCVMTWMLFQRIVPQVDELPLELDDSQQLGASQELIDSLPIKEYRPWGSGSIDEQQSCCAVCLTDFDVCTPLRQLPCRHEFHQGCIDKWLAKRKVCPLCMQNVELPSRCSSAACSDKKGA